MGIGFFVIIGIFIVSSFSYLLYLYIKGKKLEKAISELEREQKRIKLLKKSFMELKDIMTQYEESNRTNVK